MKADVYRQLWLLNSAYEEIVECLDVLRHQRGFQPGELDRFRRLSQEARAATSSFLTAVIEAAEADEAGRRFGQRLRQEKKEERGQ